MKSTKPVKATTSSKTAAPAVTKRKAVTGELFGKENFKWMLVGVAVLMLGFILMAGGGSDNPNEFNADEVYSTRRITIAPIIILIGLAIEIFAIFRQPKSTTGTEQ
jgi:hypothetical protein